MALDESIVEDAAFEWFGELGYAVGHGPHLAPGEQAGGTLIPAFSQREKEEEREAIRRLDPAIPEEASACGDHADRRATIRQYRRVQIERRTN